MALNDTKICNMALGRLKSKRINDYSDSSENTVQAIHCRLHYETTRDALIESYPWRFASARATLAADTETPDFEFDYQFLLPVDFLAMRSIYEDRFSDENLRSYRLEENLLLTNESSMEIRYIKKVTDPTKFDQLFVKLFVLLLSDELIGPLAGGDKVIQDKIDRDKANLIPTVKAMSGQQTNTIGQYDLETWNDARYT